MPLIRNSDYKAPFWLQNSHLQSIYHKFFRPPIKVPYQRERLTLSDGDFIDIDWVKGNNKQVCIMLHGLEGSSDSNYVRGMAKILANNGWDVAAMNFRGCSGEANLHFRAYHSGDYGDLEELIRHCVKKHKYTAIDLLGFSLGGNVVLRYAGIKGDAIAPVVRKVVAISVPCDLKSSAYHLSKGINKIYLRRFISSMRKKLKAKLARYPQQLPYTKLSQLTDFKLFDDYYTAPAHGFTDAHAYWEACSSKQVLTNITVPTYILTALDDQFLTPECIPIEESKTAPKALLEIPKQGGHVGFVTFNKENEYWHERKAMAFLKGE